MDRYSIKMRASQIKNGTNLHISGAEKISTEKQLYPYCQALIQRGLTHSKGKADFLNLKIEKINTTELIYLDALPITTVEVDTWQDGLQKVLCFLDEIGIEKKQEILHFLKDTHAMGGAMLLDVNSLSRLEPDKHRGIRATYMDQERTQTQIILGAEKNHYEEAIVLATKVANCPGILGEICISDDPDYSTGYVACKDLGYRRITKIKEKGSEEGGRIFLYGGSPQDVQKTIDFLQCQKVIVRNITPLKTKKGQTRFSKIQDDLAELKMHDLYRNMKVMESAQSSHIIVKGKDMILMGSNNYLDITCHPHVKSSCQDILMKYGFGSGGSRLTTGNTNIHKKLEEKIAKFKNCEAALVFNSGYVTNLCVISTLMKKDDIIFSDELNHGSIIDGCRLSNARIVVYRHNDMEDLENRILENPCENGLVVSDAVFSMDGDILHLPEFLHICEKYDLLSMIDEAHSTGVIGDTGRGILEYYHLQKKPDVLMGTLSKSIGAEGGFVAGSKVIIDYLKNRGRGFIFSTSLSPVTMAAAYAGLEIIEAEPERINQLRKNQNYFCNCLHKYGFSINSETPIIPIIVGEEKYAVELSEYLFDNGFFIPAIRYPTVPQKSARLRLALMATHTQEELRTAADLIGEYFISKQLPVQN